MTVDGIWVLKDGTLVTIEGRQYEYNNVDGSRTVIHLHYYIHIVYLQ